MASWNLRRRDTAMLAARRREGISLLQQGLHLTEVAQRLGVSPTAVGKWRRRFRAGGFAALRPRPRSGRPPRIDPHLEGYLAQLLSSDPRSRGLVEGGWTLERLADAASTLWGVSCSRGTIWRMLRRQGFRWNRAEPLGRSTVESKGGPTRISRSGWEPVPRVLILIRSRTHRFRAVGGLPGRTLNKTHATSE